MNLGTFLAERTKRVKKVRKELLVICFLLLIINYK